MGKFDILAQQVAFSNESNAVRHPTERSQHMHASVNRRGFRLDDPFFSPDNAMMDFWLPAPVVEKASAWLSPIDNHA